MIRAALLAAVLALPGAARAADAVSAAQDASAALTRAADLLAETKGARDRVAALTETVRAYEDGLSALRAGVRKAALRQREIEAALSAEQVRLSRFLGVLLTMQTSPESTVLLHPDGPLAELRAGMILADATPAVEARAAALRGQLEELAELRRLQDAASGTLRSGLAGIKAARTALSQTIQERTDPGALSSTDVATLQALVNSADTLQGFATTLASLDDAATGTDGAFAEMKGRLPAPVSGDVTTRYEMPDAIGARRPGIVMLTVPLALVTAPAPATVRYAGPLLDLGNVAILEPEAGYLIVLSGMGQVYPQAGAVLDAGDPVGLMGGAAPNADDILIETDEVGGGQERTEALYIELRQGDATLDPSGWFELSEDKDKT